MNAGTEGPSARAFVTDGLAGSVGGGGRIWFNSPRVYEKEVPFAFAPSPPPPSIVSLSLFLALHEGNLHSVLSALHSGADPNFYSTDEEVFARTPLRLACHLGDAQAVEELMHFGAEVFAHSLTDGWSALHSAARSGHDFLCKHLLLEGPDVDSEQRGFSLLHTACEVASPKMQQGGALFTSFALRYCDVAPESEQADRKGAREAGDPGKNLLEAPLHTEDATGTCLVRVTAPSPAVRAGRARTRGAGRAGGKGRGKGGPGVGGVNGHSRREGVVSWTPLHICALRGKMKSAGVLLREGADAFARTGEFHLDSPSLNQAAKRAEAGSLGETSEEAGAFLGGPLGDDLVTDSGLTPLHLACFGGHARLAALFLRHGCSPTAPSERHLWTPLHFAVWSGNSALVADICRAGGRVSVNARDRRPDVQNTPLTLAVAKGDTDSLHTLMAFGADPLVGVRMSNFPGRAFMNSEADRWNGPDGGVTSLHLAVLRGDANLFEVLLRALTEQMDANQLLFVQNDFEGKYLLTPDASAISRLPAYTNASPNPPPKTSPFVSPPSNLLFSPPDNNPHSFSSWVAKQKPKQKDKGFRVPSKLETVKYAEDKTPPLAFLPVQIPPAPPMSPRRGPDAYSVQLAGTTGVRTASALTPAAPLSAYRPPEPLGVCTAQGWGLLDLAAALSAVDPQNGREGNPIARIFPRSRSTRRAVLQLLVNLPELMRLQPLRPAIRGPGAAPLTRVATMPCRLSYMSEEAAIGTLAALQSACAEVAAAGKAEAVEGLQRSGVAALGGACRLNMCNVAEFILREKLSDARCSFLQPPSERPVHVAANFGFGDLAQLLIDYGADPAEEDESGAKPVARLCSSLKSRVAAATVAASFSPTGINALQPAAPFLFSPALPTSEQAPTAHGPTSLPPRPLDRPIRLSCDEVAPDTRALLSRGKEKGMQNVIDKTPPGEKGSEGQRTPAFANLLKM
uniref:Uncharacterized protein n=1 Tax=Chromera velia CCMP2878 TaxID=1169474 RepID=A0A0G4HAX8_9ALVE|eukprot:Cvel_6141.t1-p1 / transcript=Cvel_6141.t1 / gene=Cvel_6141 / organism=Chromera_velia_CCMP2878 / gene_product=Ankyrin-3, putative / transcript_product=Ankyrin-3, putative / location=Cvel_scaffold297:22443-32049(-) / protein_length=965 / sequence_SO=supercontig / SO=protein_coding / is_pseudo=false